MTRILRDGCDDTQDQQHAINLFSHVFALILYTYDQVTDDYGGQEERYARHVADEHAIPHGLDPLSAQYPENDHERMHEIGEVPSGHVAVREVVDVVDVILAEELHPHHGEDEDDDAQHERQVTQRAHRSTHDGDEKIQRRPRFRQFEHSQLKEIAFLFFIILSQRVVLKLVVYRQLGIKLGMGTHQSKRP